MTTVNSHSNSATAFEAVPIKSDLQEKFELQRKAFLDNPFPELDVRLDRINRIIDLLVTNEKAISEAVISDYGRRAYQLTRFQEVVSPLLNFKHARKQLPKWIKAQKHKSSFPYNLLGGKSYVQHVPLGVVGNVSPWNFPFTLSLAPLAGIMAAGNNCMLKPSEYTPNASQLMQDLISRAFGPEELTVVLGDGSVAAEFCSLPFDHLMFTGSTSIASKILQAAAPNLVPSTLELGGKCPVIITDDVDIKAIAQRLTSAKLVNAGQICMAPDYVLVPAQHYDELISEIKTNAISMFPAKHDCQDYAHIISERHCQRLKDLVNEAEQAGNKVTQLFGDVPDNTDPRYMPPALVEISNPDCQLMKEEIFGPVLPVIKIDNMADAMKEIRQRENPLVTYCFTNNREDRDIVTRKIPCGNIVFNEFFLNYVQQDLPFGGVGESGMGCYNGKEGFVNFSHSKSVFVSPKMDVGKILRPPYGKTLKNTIDKEMKR